MERHTVQMYACPFSIGLPWQEHGTEVVITSCGSSISFRTPTSPKK